MQASCPMLLRREGRIAQKIGVCVDGGGDVATTISIQCLLTTAFT